MLNVNLPDGRVIDYINDPLGRRIAKKVDGVIVEKYLWQGLTRLLAVYDGSDSLLMRFEYADGRMPVVVNVEGVTYYLAYDQVGSLIAVADGAGNVVKRIDYDSFGNIVNDTNPSFTIPFGFAGGLHDRDIGLVRFGHRDYDPDIGRWTAKDPIGFAGGDTDLYGYVLNDPINYIDPYGDNPIAIGAGGGFALGGPAGAVIGGIGGAIGGYLIWDKVVKPYLEARKKPKPGSKPKNTPPGTIPIDKSGLGKEDVHTIKDGIGARPKDWTGISPDGDVISGDADGNAIKHGPYGDYLPHNRCP